MKNVIEVKQMDAAAIAKSTGIGVDAVTDGIFEVVYTTPYTRRTFEISKNGSLIGRRYTLKTALAFINKNR